MVFGHPTEYYLYMAWTFHKRLATKHFFLWRYHWIINTVHFHQMNNFSFYNHKTSLKCSCYLNKFFCFLNLKKKKKSQIFVLKNDVLRNFCFLFIFSLLNFEWVKFDLLKLNSSLKNELLCFSLNFSENDKNLIL